MLKYAAEVGRTFTEKAEKGQNFIEMFILDMYTVFFYQLSYKNFKMIKNLTSFFLNQYVMSALRAYPPAAEFFCFQRQIFFARPAEKYWGVRQHCLERKQNGPSAAEIGVEATSARWPVSRPHNLKEAP
jgi:hypothetical protein